MANGQDTMQRIDAARQAGLSDADILQGMKESPKYKDSFANARSSGLGDEDIAKGLGLQLTTSTPQTQKDLGTQPTMSFKAEAPSALARIGHGMSEAYGGIMQGVHWLGDKTQAPINKLLGTNFDTNEYQKTTDEMKQADDVYQKGRKDNGENGVDWWSLGGELAATLPAAAASKGFQGAKILSGAGAKVLAQNSALGGLIGGAHFAENADQRISNATMGAVGGAGGAVVAKKVGDTAVKIGNVVKGNLKEGAQEIADQAKQHGVRTSVGDLARGPLVTKAETAMEQLPVVGMSGFREAQQGEVKVAATKVVDALKQKMTDTDFKSLDKITTAAASGDKNASRILGVVNNTGDDAGKILQASAEIKHWRGQQIASELYDRVGRVAGDSPITPTKTIQTIDDVIANDSKLAPNDDLVKKLSDIRKKLEDPSINTNFREMRAARSSLGDLVDEWGRSGKSTRDLTKVRTAIEDDIGDFATNSGNSSLVAQYKRADAFYKDLQFGKGKALNNAMQSETPDEIFNQFIKAGKGDRASNFYQNLDVKGQSALRYEMANQAIAKATNESTGVFSPAKFALEFERMHAPYSNIFSGAEKAQMDGFVKLMRHTERAGQYMENPANGSRLIGVAIGGTAMANLPLALKAAGASAIAKTLFTTQAGKRILLASKDLPPGSPKLENLLKQSQKLATVTGSTTAQD